MAEKYLADNDAVTFGDALETVNWCSVVTALKSNKVYTNWKKFSLIYHEGFALVSHHIVGIGIADVGSEPPVFLCSTCFCISSWLNSGLNNSRTEIKSQSLGWKVISTPMGYLTATGNCLRTPQLRVSLNIATPILLRMLSFLAIYITEQNKLGPYKISRTTKAYNHNIINIYIGYIVSNMDVEYRRRIHTVGPTHILLSNWPTIHNTP